MNRVAIVVQRCHESIVGGSEALAWQYARFLSARFHVDVLTSTALNHVSWSNELAAGVTAREGIDIRRFATDFERGPYWYELHRRMMCDVKPHVCTAGDSPRWRESQQDEYIRFQGPSCTGLYEFLSREGASYAAAVFCTYLYAPTYFGIRQVPAAKTILVPTLHDEAAAYLPAYAQRYAAHGNRAWLTSAEQRTAQRIWGLSAGDVLGMAVEHVAPASPEKRGKPYFLYCGRIEAAKGCDDLLHAFSRLPSRRRVSLVFAGADQMGLPKSSDIEYVGFVDEDRKRALMAGALAFVQPSRYESFSIVTLEAMAQGTPVLVNGASEVLRDHVELSGAGMYYVGTDDLAAKMESLCALDAGERAGMGVAGREYVLANYSAPMIRERVVDYVEQVIAKAGAG